MSFLMDNFNANALEYPNLVGIMGMTTLIGGTAILMHVTKPVRPSLAGAEAPVIGGLASQDIKKTVDKDSLLHTLTVDPVMVPPIMENVCKVSDTWYPCSTPL